MPHSRPVWTRAHRAFSLLLTVVWAGAGATKLVGLETFKGVLEAHRVVPDGLIRFALVLPIVELGIGLGFFLAGARPVRVQAFRIAAVASATLLLGFSIYVMRVPADVFRLAGCGCGGIWGLPDVSPPRELVAGVDVVLAVVSAALLWVPVDKRAMPTDTNP